MSLKEAFFMFRMAGGDKKTKGGRMMGYRKWLAILVALTMIFSMIPMMAAADAHDVPNFGFIPNSGEASVSKVDLVSMEEVARYYTAPRAAPAPLQWRTSRIAMDAEGNAWVLNVGADGTNLQGSVVRIQADTEGLNTHLYPDPVLDFGTDEAVQVFEVGAPGHMPRAIAIDGNGDIWIGFYSGGYLAQYSFDGTDLTLEDTFRLGDGESNNIKFYEMKFAPDGTLWISSRNSTPSRPGTAGIFSFDGANFTLENSVDPYSLLIADDGTVYATAYNNLLYIFDGTDWNSVTITGSSQNRGMAFDNDGKIWIASTTFSGGNFGGNTIYSYNPDGGQVGPNYTLISSTVPVGVGKDADGNMWAICRSDSLEQGFIEGFDPSNQTKVGAIQVGFRPYAYGDFVVEAPPTYGFCGYKYVDGEPAEGWVIKLEVLVNNVWVIYEVDGVPLTAKTGPDGKYCFDGLPAGTYRASEVQQLGYTQVFPDPEGENAGAHIIVLPGGETPEGTILYGTQRENSNNNGLYEIDLETGTSTRLFNAGGSGNSPNGLGFDPVNQRLYYMKVKESAPSNSQLFFYDLQLGTETAAGLSLSGQVVVGASFFEGAYYYISNLTADLHKVTLNPDGTVDQDILLWENFNGENPAVYRFGDFAINRLGMLYASTNDTGGSTAEFFSLNVHTGEYNLIADKGTPNAALLLQVSFGSDGTLYGHAAGTGEFFEIDLMSGTKSSIGYVSSDLKTRELFSDLASGYQPYDFYNEEEPEELRVTKTVVTYYEREHEWDINKWVETEKGYTIGENEDPKIWLYVDGSGDETATWYVDVTYLGYDDSDFNVSGTITIENTGAVDAVITGVVDELAGTGIDVLWDNGENFEFPYTLPAGETLTGTYDEDVDSKIEGDNVVTVTTEEDEYTAEEAIVWEEEPDEEEYASITVEDVSDLFGTVVLGTLNAADSEDADFGKFSYYKDFAWEDYGQAGSYTYNNTATIEETEQSASAFLKVNVQGYDDETAFAKGDDAVSFCDNGFSRWGWTNPIEPGTYTWDLWAGAAQCDTSKGTLVGTVDVDYDDDGNVTVVFNVYDEYILMETHVYAGDDMFPQQKQGKSTVNTVAPGQYYNDGPFDGSDIYVIAHAVVRIPDPNFGPNE